MGATLLQDSYALAEDEGPIQNGRAQAMEADGARLPEPFRMLEAHEETVAPRARLASVLSLHSEEELPEALPDLVLATINRLYDDRLRRDFENLDDIYEALKDSKACNGLPTVFVPDDDDVAFALWIQLEHQFRNRGTPIQVIRIHINHSDKTAKELARESGVLTLAHGVREDGTPYLLSYIVSGGRFNELYGWDPYFMAHGLLTEGKKDDVKDLIDHQRYQVKYGKVLNANRPYYMTRGQPPVFLSMLHAYLVKLEEDGDPIDPEWVANCIRGAIAEYKNWWMDEHHLTQTTGLSRHYDSAGNGDWCPTCRETPIGTFDDLVREDAEQAGLTPREYIAKYNAREITNTTGLAGKLHDDRIVRETGRDTTYLYVGRAANMNPVGLNSMLFETECRLAELIDAYCAGMIEGPDGDSATWRMRAKERKARMKKHMWDDKKGFQDIDFTKDEGHPDRHIDYPNATGLYPLWAGEDDGERLVTEEEAEVIVRHFLPKLVCAGGVAATDEASPRERRGDGKKRQWDHPYGWAPDQMMAWIGLLRFGYTTIAHSLIYRWLYMIQENYLKHGGAIAEKYDVVECTLEIDNGEYDNQGANEGIADGGAGFGWTNASFQFGWSLLENTQYQDKLRERVHPDILFGFPDKILALGKDRVPVEALAA